VATLAELHTAILYVSKNHYIQTASDLTLASRINNAVTDIAGGIRLLDGSMSPPLPELYSIDTVATATDAAYKALPDTYQRNVSLILNSEGRQIYPPDRGDYYSFKLFLGNIREKDLSETGDIYAVSVKGRNLYYQGIPAESENLTVHFYRKPTTLVSNGDEPSAIPNHLQMRLIKNYVGFQLAATMVDGIEPMARYHEAEFYKAANDLQDYIGVDEEILYY